MSAQNRDCGDITIMCLKSGLKVEGVAFLGSQRAEKYIVTLPSGIVYAWSNQGTMLNKDTPTFCSVLKVYELLIRTMFTS
jgi:hypothetical protein